MFRCQVIDINDTWVRFDFEKKKNCLKESAVWFHRIPNYCDLERGILKLALFI